MNIEKTVRKTKTVLLISLTIFIVLLAVGILFEVTDIKLLPNNKAVVALSFIPLGIAFASYIKLQAIKKNPQKMKDIIISENDERLIASKNQADANAFRILQGLLFFSYMGYTLMVPGDIFEATGWWLITFLLLASLILQGILSAKSTDGHDSKNNDSEDM